jgi:AcrR family transcriptional regulator
MRVIPDPRDSGTKRERTRNRLLIATQELLLERSAGSLTIRDVSHQAELSHGTFYNYFDTVEALLDNLSLLFTITHAQHMATLTTRQTLRFIAESPHYGKYLFDAGLPMDHFLRGMRAHLYNDVQRGLANGTFTVVDPELTVSLVTGGMLGMALDVYRRILPASAIDEGAARLLQQLGVRAARAKKLTTQEATFLPPPPLPITWPRGGALGQATLAD